MPKVKSFYACQSCGYQTAKWLGRCPDCGEWNTITEKKEMPAAQRSFTSDILQSEISSSDIKPQPIKDIPISKENRFTTGIGEFDRVLGGGLVAGSVVLIGGDPGIGKSTLLLQAVNKIASRFGAVLYVSGEESQAQIKMRGERLGVSSDGLLILAETLYENIVRYAAEIRPKAVVIDSIQTLYTSQLQSAPGTVSQVREVAGQLTFFAKRSNIPVIIIGHVTKDGAIAGPRLLEHMVDTVLYFEGDRGHSYRLLRAVKNRFGPVNEIGVFEMRDSGLEEVANPSELFLSERQKKVTGSVIVASMEGTRPILIELQALVSPTNFGLPRRTTVGVDYNRVSMLMAVMEKRTGLQLGNCDLFVNVVGGIRIDEPAIDLGIAAAIASSFREAAVDSAAILFGEIGLGGEIRGVSQAEQRVKEASKLGFKRCILPQRNAERLEKMGSMEIVSVSNVTDVMRVLF